MYSCHVKLFSACHYLGHSFFNLWKITIWLESPGKNFLKFPVLQCQEGALASCGQEPKLLASYERSQWHPALTTCWKEPMASCQKKEPTASCHLHTYERFTAFSQGDDEIQLHSWMLRSVTTTLQNTNKHRLINCIFTKLIKFVYTNWGCHELQQINHRTLASHVVTYLSSKFKFSLNLNTPKDPCILANSSFPVFQTPRQPAQNPKCSAHSLCVVAMTIFFVARVQEKNILFRFIACTQTRVKNSFTANFFAEKQSRFWM